ncbi:hypothetical protein MNBD_GAMMA12-2526 [hydrothermal vent metagenome]|uniref:Uncharacterized protein n=1 Tax=hydrothermal vent metagenome TaxID=652676 RepID=A0A3B0Y1J5_9ZZZZ
MHRLSILFLSVLFMFSGNISAADKTAHSTTTKSSLATGKLTGNARTKASKSFQDKYDNRKKLKLRLYSIYKEYAPLIGVKQIGAYLEKKDASCHGVAHALGKVIGEAESDLNTGMQLCGNTCTYACVHGVYKVYFTKLGKNYHTHKPGHDHSAHTPTAAPIKLNKKELRKFAQDVNNACKDSKSVVADFFKGNCAHGVGHAMAKISGNTTNATNYCKEFPSKAMRYYCETGVFMELSGGIKNKLFKNTKLRSEEISLALDYCGSKSNYPSSCLRFLLSRNKSLGQIARFSVLCNLQKPHLRRHCFNAMGFYSRTYLARNPKEFKFSCSLGKTKIDNKACISGAAYMKKDQTRRKDIKVACQYTGTSENTQYCLQQLETFYYKIDNKFLNVIL